MEKMKRKKRKEKDNKKKGDKIGGLGLDGCGCDKKEENNNTFGIIFSILSNPLLPHLI